MPEASREVGGGPSLANPASEVEIWPGPTASKTPGAQAPISCANGVLPRLSKAVKAE